MRGKCVKLVSWLVTLKVRKRKVVCFQTPERKSLEKGDLDCAGGDALHRASMYAAMRVLVSVW